MNYLTEFNRTPDPPKIMIHINYFQILNLVFGLPIQFVKGLLVLTP